MAEPANIILEFLRKHHFAKAEAAFMAELRDRPNILADNALDWDLQLSSLTSVNDADDSKHSLPEDMHVKTSEKKQSQEILPGKRASPPEKQLYVEYESGKIESQQDSSEIASKSLGEDGASSFPDYYDLGPPCNENNRGKRRVQQQDRSLMTSQSASSSERLITDCNQVSKSSDKSFEHYFVDRDKEGFHFQDLSNDSSSFQRLPGLQSPSTQPGDPWSETTGPESGADVLTSSEPSAFSKSGKEEARVSEHEKFSTSPTRNIVKISKHSSLAVDGGSKNLSEITKQWAKSMEVTNNFITGSTSCGHTALKTCLPPLLKNPQQEEQTRMLMPDDTEELRNQYTIGDSRIGIEKFRSGVIGYSLAKEPMELTPNGIQEEEFPVKLQSVDRNVDVDGRYEDPLKSVDINPLHSTFGFSTLEDDPLDQEALLSGTKKHFVYPLVSDGVMETMPDELSGFAMPGDRWYGEEYCDSDTYDDEDDPGYCRQLIDDEEWFLAYEIDYPSDSERPRYVMDKNTVPVSRQSKKVEGGHSYMDEESYFTGEEYYKLRAAKDVLHVAQNLELDQAPVTSKIHNNDIPSRDSDESKIDETEELSFIGSLPSWKGFMGQPNEVKREDVAIGACKSRGSHINGFEDENQGSGGNLGSSGAVNIGSEVREDNLSVQNSEGDLESLREQGLDLYGSTLGKFDPEDFLTSERGARLEEKSGALNNLEKEEQEEDEDEDEQDLILQYYNEAWGYSKRSSGSKTASAEAKHLSKHKNLAGHSNKMTPKNHVSEGFSFPSPSSTGEIAVSIAGSGKSVYSNRDSPVSVPRPGPDIDAYGNVGTVGPDNTLAAWKRKSDNSSPFFSSVEEALQHPIVPRDCSDSSPSTDEYASLEANEDHSEELDGSPAEFKSSVQGEKETVAAPEEDKSMIVDADQYEIFDLRIIHRKNRTGFEEAKEFPVMLNSVIAGRYHVTEYLGSAAFSKAIQAHDLHTGIDVCMKIIKNNKDFFDQSLDEIKLLKFINKHDPADKYHVLRLYDYFYHREHLFIVCELLRANLYEFQKFNKESGGEVYFTMSRIQSITRQCLEALEFLHGLGIIHCDLKPENILVKSYSRCEIKVIDLGSSCFQTDHLCSYVQSRSYRAPEVILGLPYDQKIDIWSMGCILAELSSGNVLFQNDSLATLLARVVGILGPIDLHVLAKGRDTHKYFTKNYMLYERNQETGRLEYLLPKKTSLRHRIPMGDQGFVEFVRYLLQSDPAKRPTAAEALHHPWLSFPYEPVSS